jgi:hypothetical protein
LAEEMLGTARHLDVGIAKLLGSLKETVKKTI